MLKRFLFRIARSPFSAPFIGALFQSASGLLPLNRIYDDRRIIVFSHPVPFWEFHCLAVPKKSIPSLKHLNLDDPADANLLLDAFRAIQRVVSTLGISSYRVQINGGDYQDVPQIHFHLSSGPARDGQTLMYTWQSPEPGKPPTRYRSAVIYPHPQPVRETHFLITPAHPIPGLSTAALSAENAQQALLDIFHLALNTIQEHQLPAFSLNVEVMANDETSRLCFHLVSGARL